MKVLNWKERGILGVVLKKGSYMISELRQRHLLQARL